MEATISRVRRVARTSCARNTRAPSHAATAVAASVPSSRSSAGRSRVSPTKSLRDSAMSTGKPSATSASVRRTRCSECHVFLPKSCVGSTRTLAGSMPSDTARRAAADTVRTTSVDHAVERVVRRRRGRVLHAERVRPGPRAARVGAHDPQTALGGDLHEGGVVAGPRVVDQVRPLVGGRARHLRPPGVDADHQVRVTRPDPPDQRDHPRDLVGASTRGPRPARTPPRSTMSAPSSTARATASSADASSNRAAA